MHQFKVILPNLISLLRLGVALTLPFFPQRAWIWLVVVGGVSDVADGWLARKWKVTTWIGGMLDGLADKAFVFIVLCALVGAGNFSPLWIPFVLTRDLVVALTVLYILSCRMFHSYRKVEVRQSGKIATAGQFFLFLVVLLYPDGTRIALVFATLCSIWAGYDYGRLFYRALCQQLIQAQQRNDK